MDLNSLRAHCLSFPGASEGLQWGECLLFRVANKIFVNVTLADTPPRVWVKCTPGRCTELLEIEGIRRAPYIGKHDWVELERMDLLRDAEMRELIAESYQNILQQVAAQCAGASWKKSRFLAGSSGVSQKQKARSKLFLESSETILKRVSS